MTSRLRWLSFALIAVLAIGLSGAFASTGIVVKSDPDRKISIPDELTTRLKVKAAYNDQDLLWRFEWDAPNGTFYHDYMIYQGGKWVNYSPDGIGSDPNGVMEDRLAFFVDDGSVEFFDKYGGFITISDATHLMAKEPSKEEVQAALKQDSLSKYLPETRKDPTDWRSIKSKEELEQLKKAGYFLDLWHWRSHRSNPIGYSDDQFVAEARNSDAGKSPYGTNWDADKKQPKVMFNPDKTGQYAMRWEKVLNREYGQNDHYYLSKENSVAYDPNHQWQEGDVIPRRILQTPTESHGDIFAKGAWKDGRWNLDLQRKLETSGATDDKSLRDGGKYQVAFAIHKNATAARWHYISMPLTLGLGQTAQLQATKFSSSSPDWDAIPWTEVSLLYPGKISWTHLISDGHAGAPMIKQGTPFEMAHTIENMAYYAVESEFRQEIRSQWGLTIGAVAIFFLTFSYGVIRAASGQQKQKGGSAS